MVTKESSPFLLYNEAKMGSRPTSSHILMNLTFPSKLGNSILRRWYRHVEMRHHAVGSLLCRQPSKHCERVE